VLGYKCLKNRKSYFEFFLNENIFGCRQLFIAQICKQSCSNALYFGLHKNDKHVDLSMYIFKSTFLSDCIIFM
jgi:hypothetical protein